KLDGPSDTRVAVDTKFYKHLDHGYAATVHKAQGSTVDRTYVLATPHFDRHAAYVALSRHRETATVFYAQDDFGGRGGSADPQEVQNRLVEKLSRARIKDLAHDYLEREGSAAPASAPELTAQPERDRKADRFRGLKLKTNRVLEHGGEQLIDLALLHGLAQQPLDGIGTQEPGGLGLLGEFIGQRD